MANRHCERMLNIANLLEKGKSKYNDLTLVRKSSLKILQVTNAGEGMEEKKPSYLVGGNVIWCSYHREYRGSLKSISRVDI